MKSFEVGPPQAQGKIYPKNETAAGAAVTNYILLENGSDVLLDESSNKLILE